MHIFLVHEITQIPDLRSRGCVSSALCVCACVCVAPGLCACVCVCVCVYAPSSLFVSPVMPGVVIFDRLVDHPTVRAFACLFVVVVVCLLVILCVCV